MKCMSVYEKKNRLELQKPNNDNDDIDGDNNAQ